MLINKVILKLKKTFLSLIPNLVLVSIHHSKMFAPLSDSEVFRRFRIHKNKIAKSGDTKKNLRYTEIITPDFESVT